MNETLMKSNNNTAFTFAELMISLVIIAVITALLYPTISEISPNNNKQLFRSAYKTIELVVSEIAANNEDISDRDKLCNAFKSRLNTVNFTEGAGVGAASKSGCDDANETLQTSNGMRWYFANYDAGTKTNTIYVDVNASNNKVASQACTGCSPAEVGTAPNTVWPNGCFRINNSTVRDTFRIDIGSNGKIEIADSIGAEHLKDTTE